MGMDLARLPTSVLFGFILFGIFVTAFGSMAVSSGNPITGVPSFDINKTVTAAQNIESKIHTKGTNDVNTFFPAIGILYDVWDLISSIGSTLTQAIETFFTYIAAGSPYIVLLKTAIVVAIALAIAFIVLDALFRKGGWKTN